MTDLATTDAQLGIWIASFGAAAAFLFVCWKLYSLIRQDLVEAKDFNSVKERLGRVETRQDKFESDHLAERHQQQAAAEARAEKLQRRLDELLEGKVDK